MIRLRLAAGLAAILLVPAGRTVAQNLEQQRFPSPAAAFKALIDAAKGKNHERLLAIVAPSDGDLLSSGNQVADREATVRFVQAAKEKATLVPSGDGTVLVHIGKTDWTFPIPLIKDGDQWRFNAAAGKEELLNRRIGRNELATIAVCHAYVDAQREYASKERHGTFVRQYAQKLRSQRDGRDGLYWQVAANDAPSPMGPLVAAATSAAVGANDSATEPAPFHGYWFKILAAQGSHAPGGERSYIVNGHMIGGFALVAYPERYGSSGIMTFVVNQLGVVFQKNLGEETGEIAAAMTQYDPDDSWSPVEE